MSGFIKIIKLLLSVIFVLFLHYFSKFILPYPFNNINIVLFTTVFIIVWRESGVFLWFSFLLYFLLELSSPNQFGMILLPGSLAAMSAYWLYVVVFTNKSWYSTIVLTMITVAIYRLIYTAIKILSVFLQGEGRIIWGDLFLNYMWEMILTSLLTGAVVYIFSNKLSARNKNNFSLKI